MTTAKVHLHEELVRDRESTRASDRSFGFVFTAVFLVVAFLPLVRGHGTRVWAIWVAAVFLLLAIVRPALLAPLNRVWFLIGELLHRVVSPVVLGFLFYLVFTPIGALMRASGKRQLHLKFDRGLNSYWIAREPAGPTSDTMKRQY